MALEVNGNPIDTIEVNGNPIDRVEVNGNVVYQATSPLGSTISRPADNLTQTGHTNWMGISVEPSRELAGFQFVVSNNTSELERAGLQTHEQGGTDWIVQESYGKVGPGTELRLEIPNEADYLQPGTQYDLLVDNGGDEFARGVLDSTSYPYTSADFDVIEGMYSTGSSNTNWYNINDVTAIVDPSYGMGVSRPADNRVGSGHVNWNGFAVEPKTTIAGFRLRVSDETSQLERVGIQTHQQGGTDWIVLESFGKLSAGDEVEIIIPNSGDYLQAGVEYDVLLDNGGDEYTRGAYQADAQYPYRTDNFDVSSGMYSSGSESSSNFYSVDQVRAILNP